MPGKPTPPLTAIQADIKNEISTALERLGADRFLLATVGSWGDTLSEEDVLDQLRTWNLGLPPLDEVWASTSKDSDATMRESPKGPGQVPDVHRERRRSASMRSVRRARARRR